MTQHSRFSRKALTAAEATAPGIVFDERRNRTAWFEGQHVLAEDFNRDQSYHLTRHADLGRVVGQGVAEGLEVRSDTPSGLTISAGLGLAASGEVIDLARDVVLDLADIPTQRRLNAALKSARTPVPPPETRTGLFVLSASVVEFTSNPVASYPVSATSTRRLQDSLVSEAVLFSLTPEPMASKGINDLDWRSDAAWRVFHEGREPEVPPQALALAMVALEGNRVIWVDTPMMRRALMSQAEGVAGLAPGLAARRRAHFAQFDGALQYHIDSAPGGTFSAAQVARSIPAVGRMPRNTVARRSEPGGPMRLSQSWLPADMPVELVALPVDEIDALIEEAALLPPIDLSASPDVLANTPVTFVVPVQRADWMETPAEVIEARLPLRAPPAVGGRATDPEDLLRALLDGTGTPAAPTDDLATDAWSNLLAGVSELWYLRRTQNQRTDLAIDGIRRVSGEGTGDGGGDGNGDGTGDGGPVTPPAPMVDWDGMIQPLRDSLRALHVENLADGFVEGLFAAEGETQLRFLQHLLQIHARGAISGVFAITEAVQNGRTDVEEAVASFPPNSFDRLAALEHGMFGTGHLLLPVGTTPAQTGARSSIYSKLLLENEDAARTLGQSGMPLLVPAKSLADPDALRSAIGSALEAGFDIRFAASGARDETAMKQRLRMIGTGQGMKLGATLEQIDPGNIPEGMQKLREALADASLSGQPLGETLLQIAGEMS